MEDLNELSALMETLTEQNLQMALVFEKILAEMEAPPSDDGLVKTLEKLLAPLVDSSQQIKGHLGI